MGGVCVGDGALVCVSFGFGLLFGSGGGCANGSIRLEWYPSPGLVDGAPLSKSPARSSEKRRFFGTQMFYCLYSLSNNLLPVPTGEFLRVSVCSMYRYDGEGYSTCNRSVAVGPPAYLSLCWSLSHPWRLGVYSTGRERVRALFTGQDPLCAASCAVGRSRPQNRA